MRIFSMRPWLISVMAISLLTVGVSAANADGVALFGGGSVSGSLVVTNFGGALELCNDSNCPGHPWTVTAGGTSWTSATPSGEQILTSGTERNLFSGETYTLVELFFDDSTTGNTNELFYAVEGTFVSFEQSVLATPLGQTIQIPLLTTVGSGACNSLGACSSVRVSTGAGTILTSIVGPAFLDITNDPGFFEVTPTSTPLETGVPEPSTLLLLGAGLLSLMTMTLFSKRFA